MSYLLMAVEEEIAALKADGRKPRLIVCTWKEWSEYNRTNWVAAGLITQARAAVLRRIAIARPISPDAPGRARSGKMLGLPVEFVADDWFARARPHVLDAKEAQVFFDHRAALRA